MTASDIVEEGRQVVAAASEAGLTVRLLGGVAVRCLCPDVPAPLVREPRDIDLFGRGREAAAVGRLLQERGYEPHRRFNALHGRSRLLYEDPQRGRRVDVFLDVFRMCHTFRPQVAGGITLTPSDLLLTKLQMVELESRDTVDILALLASHEPDGSIAARCGGDWGLWRTCGSSLTQAAQALARLDLGPDQRVSVSCRLEALREALVVHPKTAGWRCRAMVGGRWPWYALPEKPLGR